MNKPIKGKKYYVSDCSMERARQYKRETSDGHLFEYTGTGRHFISADGITCPWKYWVAEEAPVHKDKRQEYAEFVAESTVSLISACLAVGGCPPSLDMTLKEFLGIYGWNGVGFTVLEGKKHND